MRSPSPDAVGQSRIVGSWAVHGGLCPGITRTWVTAGLDSLAAPEQTLFVLRAFIVDPWSKPLVDKPRTPRLSSHE
jgi:hypothetical protein